MKKHIAVFKSVISYFVLQYEQSKTFRFLYFCDIKSELTLKGLDKSTDTLKNVFLNIIHAFKGLGIVFSLIIFLTLHT